MVHGTSGLMGVGSIKKIAECEPGSKLVSKALFLGGLFFSSCLLVSDLSTFLGFLDDLPVK